MRFEARPPFPFVELQSRIPIEQAQRNYNAIRGQNPNQIFGPAHPDPQREGRSAVMAIARRLLWVY
jgi:hypothetical protein